MAIQKKFLKSSETLASFDWVDLASGTGFVVYKGGTGISGASTFLSNNDFYSNTIESLATGTGTTATKEFDLDFDLSAFNLPQTIRGTAIVTVPMGIRGESAGGKTYNMYYIAKIRKWNGTTETEVASATSDTHSQVIADDARVGMTKTVQITVPATHFKKGEVLRLTIEGWAWASAGSDSDYAIGHDPKDRNVAEIVDTDNVIPDTTPTILEFHVPYKVDL